MSIIERVADMLGPVTPQPRKRSLAGGVVDAFEPDLIERAASDNGKRPSLPADQDLAVDAISRQRSVRTGQSTTRILTVDLDKLREKSMITPDSARTPTAESFRQIKRHIVANVANPKAEPGTNLVMVTSALPGEGKTFCSINLASSIAMEMDRTVLLVDADVARPSVLNALGVEAERGLMDVLLDSSIDLGDVLCKTNIGKLNILPAGTQHHQATELLGSEAMRVLLLEMAERYRDRIIIFDSPPLLAASESAALASRMGQILIVVEAGKTTESALKDALHRIDARNVVGLVLNKGQVLGSGYDGGYGYGYGYGE